MGGGGGCCSSQSGGSQLKQAVCRYIIRIFSKHRSRVNESKEIVVSESKNKTWNQAADDSNNL